MVLEQKIRRHAKLVCGILWSKPRQMWEHAAKNFPSKKSMGSQPAIQILINRPSGIMRIFAHQPQQSVQLFLVNKAPIERSCQEINVERQRRREEAEREAIADAVKKKASLLWGKESSGSYTLGMAGCKAVVG